jgi:transposase InsO family protein
VDGVTVSRPARLRVGEQVAYRGCSYTVATVSNSATVLTGADGSTVTVGLTELFADHSFTVAAGAHRTPLPSRGLLEGLPVEVVAKAQWWERHILEVLTGAAPADETSVEPGASSGSRPDYDPLRGTLRQREIAKTAELAGQGHPVSLSTLQRMRRRYQARGLLGLVDGRITRGPGAAVDERVRAAIRTTVAAETDRSTGTVTRLRRRVEQILRSEHGIDPATVMPARSTFYRLVERVAAGRHTFGSAPTRRSLAQRPEGPFGSVPALRPGEWMPIDSTPLDVRVVLDDGTPDRAELTMMVDVATRSIPAAVLRPSTKAVDAALLLARAVTPEPMRPGWVDALRMSRSVLPHQRLVDIDARLEHAAARPVVVPETIVCDHGMVYLSQSFRAACRAMGINVQPTHPGSPWEKGIVERTFASIATLFAQHVAGYVGRSVDRRGHAAEGQAVWSLVELQDLLDEWIVTHWQNRPHDGLAHPLTPSQLLTPNEQYAALVEVAGYVPVPLAAEDYVELLPATWRVINAYGIKISHRTYDSPALNPYRRQHSGLDRRNGRWEVHYDPYDVTRVWVRNHLDGGWITAAWTHLSSCPTPFGEQAWAQARDVLARRGGDPASETERAAAVSALLDKAEHGPGHAGPARATRRDRRVAARTRATTGQPSWPAPLAASADPHDTDDTDDSERIDHPDDAGDCPATGEARLAPVTPLGVFDARAEAQNWW